MIVLVADDITTNRKLLRVSLEAEGYDVMEARDGCDALDIVRTSAVPVIGLIDWEMPGLEGPEVCRRVREMAGIPATFLFLVTVRQSRADVAAAFDAGANDYVVKPVDRTRLMARVRTAARMLRLQNDLAGRTRELEEARAHVRALRGLLPVCACCAKFRDDLSYQRQVQEYVASREGARFGLGICPECLGDGVPSPDSPSRLRQG